MKFYYEIIRSWWEVFPEDAHKAAVEIRKEDPYYRYNLGDRIYVRLRTSNK